MILPSDSIFNTRIDQLPLDPNSSAYSSYAIINGMWISYAWGTNIVDSSAPLTTETFYYTPYLNGIGFPIPPLPDKKRETGAYTTDGNNDHHMIVLNRQTCQIYETYQDGNHNSACPSCTAQSGWTYASNSYKQPGGGTTDAAGLPLEALTLHLAEIRSGAVTHALRFSACAGCISNSHAWPATSSTGGQAGAAPMGARFRLRASYDISSFPAAAQVVLKGLQQYGAFLADIGTSGNITASTDITEDLQVVQALKSLGNAHFKPSDFEVVDESSLMSSPSSNRVNQNNPYVQPANYAVLTVIDSINPNNSVQLPIALEPVSVGMPNPSITVQAGTPGFPVSYWVTGTTNQQVSWSISPATGAGAIGADGTYTAPPAASGVVHATITAVSNADSTASASAQINIIPAGVIRIDSGSSVATKDGYGNTWLPDMAFETASYNTVNDSYPAGLWGYGPDAIIDQTFMYTWGDDIVYDLHVPNGDYSVGLTFGLACGGTYSPTSTFDNGLVNGALDIETQGQLVLSNWDPGVLTNWACRTPATTNVPATVSDTKLRIAIRATGGYDTHSAPFINAVTISAVAPTANIQPNTTAITFPGQTLNSTSEAEVVTLTNTQTLTAAFTGVSLTGPNAGAFAIAGNNCGSELAGGGTCQISLTFTPTAVGAQTAVLNVADSATNSPQTVALNGTGVGIPQAVVTPAAIAFAAQAIGTTSAPQIATLSNPGTGPLPVTSVGITGANANSFVVSSNGCGSKVAAGTSCQIAVSFEPSSVSRQSASLTVSDSVGTQTVSLTGKGKHASQSPGVKPH